MYGHRRARGELGVCPIVLPLRIEKPHEENAVKLTPGDARRHAVLEVVQLAPEVDRLGHELTTLREHFARAKRTRDLNGMLLRDRLRSVYAELATTSAQLASAKARAAR